MQKALITGASGGIGYELAVVMAKNGHDLVLVARNIKKLNTVKKEFEEKYKVSVKVYETDLSVVGSALAAHKALKNDEIEILVNNAGVGLKGNFFDDDLAATQQMAYLNMNSLMDLTYYFGNDFRAKGTGKILNIGSIVSFFPGPKQPVYYASKAFVRSFSRALAYNLQGSGVSVTALYPGVTKTNFFNAAKASSMTGGASAQSVAELGYKAMMEGRTEVTHGFKNKIITNVLSKIVPARLQPKIIDKVSEF